MAVDLAVVKTHWSGTSGGPGITQMAFQAQTDPHTWDAATAQAAVNAVHAFWDAIKGALPNNISLSVDPNVDVFNVIDAGLVGTAAAATAPAPVNGTDFSSFNMATGIKITLRTASILNRRRVHGGIFVVPVAGSCFDGEGVVTSGTQSMLLDAANILKTSMTSTNAGMCVWSRPKKAKATKPARDGASSDITGFSINQHGAILRGRRD